jgi:cell division inhibitor SepF
MQMGVRDYWDRMLVYFGITEEAEHGAAPARRTSTAVADEWDDLGEPAPRRAAAKRRPAARPVAGGAAGVGVVPPKTFNDAQSIADHFKRGVPVIVNLQQTDAELSKRLIDFASGLTYGCDGSMKRIADKVFLLTPAEVQVSAEEEAALLESGGFFNQS